MFSLKNNVIVYFVLRIYPFSTRRVLLVIVVVEVVVVAVVEVIGEGALTILVVQEAVLPRPDACERTGRPA